MADAKLTALTEISVPALEDLLYTVDDPAGTPVSDKVTAQRLMGLLGREPGGRLTLTTATPVTTSDVTAAGTLFYTPYLHTLLPVFDGTRWLLKTFAEISLALTLTADKNHDVFVDDDAATLSLSAAWTNDTTRADALGTQDGVTVLNSDKTKRWLGTLRASGTDTTEDSRAKRFLWNAYHRRRRPLLRQETTASWTYATAAWRQVNASAANRVETVTGLVGEPIDLTSHVMASGSNIDGAHAVGQNSTTTPHADCVGIYFNSAADIRVSTARLVALPRLGYDAWNWLELGVATTITLYGQRTGTSPPPYQTGLSGACMA